LDVTFDAMAPTVAISSPTGLSTYVTSLGTVTLGGTSADNVAVATISWLNAANGANGSTGTTAVWTTTAIVPCGRRECHHRDRDGQRRQHVSDI